MATSRFAEQGLCLGLTLSTVGISEPAISQLFEGTSGDVATVAEVTTNTLDFWTVSTY